MLNKSQILLPLWTVDIVWFLKLLTSFHLSSWNMMWHWTKTSYKLLLKFEMHKWCNTTEFCSNNLFLYPPQTLFVCVCVCVCVWGGGGVYCFHVRVHLSVCSIRVSVYDDGFYMPVSKTGRIMLRCMPFFCKLFRFRLTPPKVYIRSSWNLVYS